jgi:hypothetical protein
MLLSRCLALLVVGLFLLTTFPPASAFETLTERRYNAEQYDMDDGARLDEMVPTVRFVLIVAAPAPSRDGPTPLALIQSPRASRAPPSLLTPTS